MAAPTALAEPGIDIRKLTPGTILLVEAEPWLYEIKVVYPVHGIVEISSSDPHLRVATVGQVLQSVHWPSLARRSPRGSARGWPWKSVSATAFIARSP